MPIDISIRTWKLGKNQAAYPTWWLYYRSPDIFVDNFGGNRVAKVDTSVVPNFKYYDNVDAPGEPCIGLEDNRLFAVIRNNGNTSASDVKVSFSFCPFGAGYGDYKLIRETWQDCNANEEIAIEVPWDLSDLSETNGGQWPVPLGNLSDFCMKVVVEHPQSITPKQEALHNFKNIISSKQPVPDPIVIANKDNVPKLCEIIAPNLPSGWKLIIRGVGESNLEIDAHSGAKFSLSPGEQKLLTLTILPTDLGDKSIAVELTVLMDGIHSGGFSFLAKKGIPRRVISVPPRFVPLRVRRSVPTRLSGVI